jgi:hypothetical protein
MRCSMRMKSFMRIVYTLVLMAVVTICMFGFIDTLEPMPRLEQFTWRSIFSVAGLSALAAIVWIWLKPRRHTAVG